MFDHLPILSIITFIPVVVALMLAVAAWTGKAHGREQLERNAPLAALVASIAVLILSIMMTIDFDSSEAGFQFVESVSWLGGGIDYRVGVDGISVLFLSLIHI